MKKIKILILAAIMTLSLAITGCSSEGGIKDGTTNNNNRPEVSENGNGIGSGNGIGNGNDNGIGNNGTENGNLDADRNLTNDNNG